MWSVRCRRHICTGKRRVEGAQEGGEDGEFFCLIDRHGFGLLEVQIAEHHAAVALDVLDHRTDVEHRLDCGAPFGRTRHFEPDVIYADQGLFGWVRKPALQLERHAARLARGVHSKGLRVAVGLEAVLDPGVDIAFPESVVQLFRGELGQPVGGFPRELQSKVLAGRPPLTARPGELLPTVDLAAERSAVEKRIGRAVTDAELASHLMYPKVFADYAVERATYGDVGTLPTAAFFYGMEPGQEISIDLERGKSLIVRYVTTSDAHEDGTRTVFFELNGQPRPLRVPDRSQVAKRPPSRKVEPGNLKHVGAPMPGTLGTVAARAGMEKRSSGCFC